VTPKGQMLEISFIWVHFSNFIKKGQNRKKSVHC
jgi:hypothetical protein